MSQNYKFNQNTKCEYYPCHKGADKETFNCLFCYCPLYMLEDECGGDFKVTKGVKDCWGCTKPHDEEGYAFIMSKMKKVLKTGSTFIKEGNDN